MSKEIERKFLLKEFPKELENQKGKHILQGYVSIDPEVRVRKKGNKFFLTKKNGSGLTREETEIEISESIFSILWDTTKYRRIEKIRYEVGGFEIDRYLGKLKGLYIVEIELESEDQKFEFLECLKDIQKIDVTEDCDYKNQSLVVKGKPNRKKLIETIVVNSFGNITYILSFKDFKYVVSKTIYCPLNEEKDEEHTEVLLTCNSHIEAKILYREYIGDVSNYNVVEKIYD